MDVNVFSKENLPDVSLEVLGDLKKEEIEVLAKHYFYVEPILLIQPKDGSGVKSPATWRSLNSLLKLGKEFKIVGLLNIKPRLKPQKDVISPVVENISKIEFLAPEKPIIASEEPSAPPVIETEIKKRGRKPKNKV